MNCEEFRSFDSEYDSQKITTKAPYYRSKITKQVLQVKPHIVFRRSEIDIETSTYDQVKVVGFDCNFLGNYAKVVSLRVAQKVVFGAGQQLGHYTVDDFKKMITQITPPTVKPGENLVLRLSFDWHPKSWLVRAPAEFRCWYIVEGHN